MSGLNARDLVDEFVADPRLEALRVPKRKQVFSPPSPKESSHFSTLARVRLERSAGSPCAASDALK